MSDIKYQLRKIGFPQCAKEALQIIERLIFTHTAGRTVISNSMELADEIISEFIFCERNLPGDSKAKTLPKRSLSSIQELQLLEILCSHFSRGGNVGLPSMVDAPSLRNALFMCLFPCGDQSRAHILVKLISMVVGTRSCQVLGAARTWLQQTGPTTPSGLALAKSLVNDYLVLVPEAVQQLDDLPRSAPEFAANFLAAVAELYGGAESLPPPALLNVVALWASKSPELCTVAVTTTQPRITPFLGLVRWCVMAPLHGAGDLEPYSQLHLALLESVVLAMQDRLVSVQQLLAMVTSILLLSPTADPARLKQTLDRFAQTVIILLRTGNVAGNMAELFEKIDCLPQNELLEGFGMCRNVIIAPPYYRLLRP